MIEPIISEIQTFIFIFPCSIFENFFMPVDHVLEEIVKVSQQIVRPINIIKTEKGEHLTHQKCLQEFLIEEIIERSVS